MPALLSTVSSYAVFRTKLFGRKADMETQKFDSFPQKKDPDVFQNVVEVTFATLETT